MTNQQILIPSNSEAHLGTLLELVWGFVPSRVLIVAIDAGFFECFGDNGKESKSIKAICSKLNWQEQPAHILIQLLTKSSLCSSNQFDEYVLTDLASVWLRQKSSKNILSLIERRKKLEQAYESLATVLATNKPDAMMHSETMAAFGVDLETTRQFITAVSSMASAFEEPLIESISTFLPFNHSYQFLDVGCSDGTLSHALYKKFPNASIDVLDVEGVIDFAHTRIASSALTDRIYTISSKWQDWNFESKKYDLILLSQVLHEFTEIESSRLFEKTAAALNKNGLLVVVILGESNSSGTDNLHSIFSMNLLVEIGGANVARQWLDLVSIKNAIQCVYHEPLGNGRSVWIGKKLNQFEAG